MKNFSSLALICGTLVTATSAFSAEWIESRVLGNQTQTRSLSSDLSNQVADRYIVELVSAPLLQAKRLEIAALQQASRMTTQQQSKQAQQIANQRLSVQNYQALLQRQQDQFVAAVSQHKTAFKVLASTNKVMNALMLEMTADQVNIVSQLSQVKAVHPVKRVTKFLTESVPLISADKLWQQTDSQGQAVTGKGVKVAVIDSGVDYTHPALGGCFGPGCKVTSGYDFVQDDSDPMDVDGHGTHVAGIIAGNGGLKGVAPDAEIIALRALDDNGSGFTDDIIKAIEYAVDPDNNPATDDGADVINMSLGGPGNAEDAVSKAVDSATASGVTVVVAAGNTGLYKDIENLSPSSAKSAITVGSSTKAGKISTYSSRGSSLSNKPEIVAPGENIKSMAIGTGFVTLSGTSMASPHVAGAAALLLQAKPAWTPEDIKKRFISSAKDLGEDPYSQGHGQIDVLAALNAQFTLEGKKLALGKLDTTQASLSFNAEIIVSNLTANSLDLTLAAPDGLPANVSIGNFEPTISLPGSGSKVIPLTITITDVANLIDAVNEVGLYFDSFTISSANQTAHVPMSFEKNYIFTLSNPTDIMMDASIFDDKGNSLLWDYLAPQSSKQFYGANKTLAIRLKYLDLTPAMVPSITLPPINPANKLSLLGYEEMLVVMDADKQVAGDLSRLTQVVGLGQANDVQGNNLLPQHKTVRSSLISSVMFKHVSGETTVQHGTRYYSAIAFDKEPATQYLLVGPLRDEIDSQFDQVEGFSNSNETPLRVQHYQKLNVSQNQGQLWSFQQGQTASVMVDVDDSIKGVDTDVSVSLYDVSIEQSIGPMLTPGARMEYSLLSQDNSLRPYFYAVSRQAKQRPFFKFEPIASIRPQKALTDYSRTSVVAEAAYYASSIDFSSQNAWSDVYERSPFATLNQGVLFTKNDGKIQFNCNGTKSDWLAYDALHKQFENIGLNGNGCSELSGQIQFNHFLAKQTYTSTVDFSLPKDVQNTTLPKAKLALTQNGAAPMPGSPVQGNVTIDIGLTDMGSGAVQLKDIHWKLGDDSEWQTLPIPAVDSEGMYSAVIPRYIDSIKPVSLKLTYGTNNASVTQTLNGMFFYGLDKSDTGDIDGDGILNKDDADMDGDGALNANDEFPFDSTESVDTDKDGIGNNADEDDDGDNVPDNVDAFPLDPNESVDTDRDGTGNNADKDDDGDGIVDTDDRAPLDPKVGDDQAPVIAVTPELTIEASGPLTALELKVPAVTDNNLNPATIASSYAEPLPLGRHEIVWTATDFAGNKAQRIQIVNLVDTTAPVFDTAEIIQIDATGIYTLLPENLAVIAHDLVDGPIRVQVSGEQRYRPGLYKLTAVAKDGSGNQSSALISLAVKPQVQIASTAKVMAGQKYQAGVQLSGQAAFYPVRIRYELNGELNEPGSGELVIESGNRGHIEFSVAGTAKEGASVEVTLLQADNATVDSNQQYQASVISQNLAPKVALQLMQGGKPVAVIDQNAGLVTVLAKVEDINAGEVFSFAWRSNDAKLADSRLDALAHTFEFDPMQLSSGVYSLALTVVETETKEAHSVEVSQQLLVQSLAQLSSEADSDADGISDFEEGYKDNDGDGIADYLDNDGNVSVLPLTDGRHLQVAPGQSLALGQYGQLLNNGTRKSAQLTKEELARLISDASLLKDGGYYLNSEVLDFTVAGLPEPGASVAIVVRIAPLTQGSEYRKFSASKGWRGFVENSRNAISSATVGADGNCPNPMDAHYKAGLNAGDECVQLLIEDGGANDDDGVANGVVQDPGAFTLLNRAPTLALVAHSNTVAEGKSMSLAVTASDTDGDSLTYSWVQVSGPSVTLSNVNTASISFTAPEVNADQTLVFEVTVSDGMLSSKLNTSITVTNTAEPVKPTQPSSPSGSGGSIGGGMLILLCMVAGWRKNTKRVKRLVA